MKKSKICRHSGLSAVLALSLFLPMLFVLAGCTVDFMNAKPAQEIKPASLSSGDLYAGWRVFQEKCASCHDSAATGTDKAPNLLPIVKDMNARQFAELVLKRYDLGSGLPSNSQEKTTYDTRIDEIMRGTEPPIEMPAWQGEPAVNAHVLDLYAYLSARTEGRLSSDRPIK